MLQRDDLEQDADVLGLEAHGEKYRLVAAGLYPLLGWTDGRRARRGPPRPVPTLPARC